MKNKLLSVAAALLSLVFGDLSHAQQAVLQRGYDSGLSGANLSETTLTVANVTPSTFGLLATLAVDADVYAQPLYVPNVVVAGQGMHNVLYVASMNDTLYAFDADSGAPLWSVNFATSVGSTPAPIANFTFSGNQNIVGNVGILSTPVIDASTNILYLVACTLENNTLVYRLHAVDITSGSEPITNVVVSGAYGGITFDGRYQTQRSSLTLAANQVVFGFGAVELEYPGGYSGWVMSYNKQTLVQSGSFATVASGTKGGGVWQSGRPPAVDSSGYVYVFTGNGYQSGYNGVNAFSESVLKLDPANQLALVDWFTPSNWSTLDSEDQDLASSGPLLVPGTGFLAGGGKAGTLYLLNTSNLGHLNPPNIPQVLSIAPQFRGGPVYWQRSAANGGPLLYNWGASDNVKAFAFNGSMFVAPPAYQGTIAPVYPGGILSLSANADTPGTGILWGTAAPNGNLYDDPTDPGILYAMDASDVSKVLWSSNMNAARDALGNFAKFVPPTIANGKVYVATFSNKVLVYGQLAAATPTFSPAPGTYTGTQQLTLADMTPNAVIHYTTDSTTPTGSSPVYIAGSPLSVTSSETIEAIAIASGYSNSAVASGIYTIAPVSVSLSPNPVIFGTQGLNTSTSVPIMLQNTGTGALPITAIALSGGAVGQFSETNTCGNSVAVGGSCSITLVFKPSSVGAKATTLIVTSGSVLQRVRVSGTAGAATYSVTPLTLAFGPQAEGTTSATQSVAIANTSLVPLPITSIAMIRGESKQFSESNNCLGTLAAGAACSIQVNFLPSGNGDRSTTLEIVTQGGAKTQFVALSGSGVTPTYTLSPATLTFGNTAHGTQSAPLPVTVTNTGPVPLSIIKITTGAPNAAQFVQSNNCGSSLAAGASCAIQMVFAPSSVGAKSTVLTLNAAGGAGSQKTTVSGTGT